jgi:hypothetical protein
MRLGTIIFLLRFSIFLFLAGGLGLSYYADDAYPVTVESGRAMLEKQIEIGHVTRWLLAGAVLCSLACAALDLKRKQQQR